MVAATFLIHLLDGLATQNRRCTPQVGAVSHQVVYLVVEVEVAGFDIRPVALLSEAAGPLGCDIWASLILLGRTVATRAGNRLCLGCQPQDLCFCLGWHKPRAKDHGMTKGPTTNDRGSRIKECGPRTRDQ